MAAVPNSRSAAFAAHGGALDHARKLYPAAPLPWMDLSTGINPMAYPLPQFEQASWARLPQESDLHQLEETAAIAFAAPRGCQVVAAPGSQSLILQLPALGGGSDVRILGPTYDDYRRVFRQSGAAVRVVPTIDHLAGADLAVVVNPNNPDGRVLRPAVLLALAPRVGLLVIDEAFADAEDRDLSVVPHLRGPRCLVLRSFGKFFGLAGARLGFALGFGERMEALRGRLGDWPVAGPTLDLGRRALADRAWAEAMRRRLRADAARLAQVLRGAGTQWIGGTGLFCLVSHPAAALLFEHLAAHGILVRPFALEPTWLRFGHPADEHQWQRLAEALRRFG